MVSKKEVFSTSLAMHHNIAEVQSLYVVVHTLDRPFFILSGNAWGLASASAAGADPALRQPAHCLPGATFDHQLRCSKMHELSVCQAMLDQLEQLARRHQAQYVEVIDVEIGELSGVDAVLLADAFSVMKTGTCAANAILNTRSVTTRVLCIECGKQSYTRPNHLVCSACDGFRVSVVEGNELRLRDVKLNLGA